MQLHSAHSQSLSLWHRQPQSTQAHLIHHSRHLLCIASQPSAVCTTCRMRFRNVNGLLGKLELTAASLTPQASTMLGMSAAVSSSRHHIGKVAQVYKSRQCVAKENFWKSQSTVQSSHRHCIFQAQHCSRPICLACRGLQSEACVGLNASGLLSQQP